jgi:hypothetical protein
MKINMIFREKIRTWLIEHPKYNPYRFSSEKAFFPFRFVTNQIRCLPNFIIIGASRCGTTSLYYNLNKHPNVYAGAAKSSSFFDKNFHNGLNYYRSHFPIKPKLFLNNEGKNIFVTGEASTSYLLNPIVPEKIFKTIPNVKLIAIIRNPIDRAFSHFNYHLTRGESKFSSFEEAIEFEEELLLNGNYRKNIFENKNLDYRFYSYLSEGNYYNRFKEYLKYFPLKQILVLNIDDLAKNHEDVFDRTFNFLNLPKFKILNPKILNSVKYDKLNLDTRNHLLNYYKPFNKKLSELLNQNFNWT